MGWFLRGSIILLNLALLFLMPVYSSSSTGPKDELVISKSSRSVLDNDMAEAMEPFIVDDPVDGRPWWYTPSRKAHIFQHRHRSAIKRLQSEKRAGSRQGEDMRLSGDLVPIEYKIRMLPFVDLISTGNYTIDGYIEISFRCVRATSNVSMNAADLVINTDSVVLSDIAEPDKQIAIAKYVDEQVTREIITFQTESQLVVGKQYKIKMSFTATMNNELLGFYRSSYVDEGVTKWLAVTQMEATYARRAFPCFDEPSMKANFTVTLGHKEGLTSVSNMKQVSSGPISGMPGYYWDYFAPSVKMSSYLVAFLVSDFINIPASPGASNVQFRIWARANARNLTTYAIDIGPRILEYFESYFSIDFPLSKQDMAAIPDFYFGAMENWGLITYRESDLLIDTKTASARQKQRVAIVSAHELAHQWFGDLVTMDWWNAIWLNEGFASYMEFIGTDSVEPDFKMNDQFVVENLQYVFGIDGLETSRPINIEVNTPEEIASLFDAISYEKGSCIIRMCADFLGLETFQRGLTRYLKANSYGNAQQDDLWRALQEQADIDGVVLPATVKEIMDTWTYKMGYPVIHVTRDYVTTGASVSQERFLLRKTNASATDPTVYRWWVPLTYTYSGLTSTQRLTTWLSMNDSGINIDKLGANPDKWVIFNVDQQNYYRVKYDDENYRLLALQLLTDHHQILTNNRAQLLDDTFILASTHMVPYKAALDMSMYLQYEKDYVPWNAVTVELNYIDTMLYRESQYPDWKVYMTLLVTPYYNHVGFQETESDAHLTIYSRTDAMTWACKLQMADCVQNAKTKYAEQMSDPDNDYVLSANQRLVILKTGVENGGQAEWDFAWSQYLSKGSTAYLEAATCTKDSTRLYNLLEMMLKEESGIRQGDINRLFNYIASNPLGNPLATNFLITRWTDIENSWLGTSYFVNFFRYLCNRQNTQAELDKLLKLRDDHYDILGSSSTVQQGLDIVKENVKWMALHQQEIGYWLNPTSATTTTTSTTTETSQTTTNSATTSPTTSAPSAGSHLNHTNAVVMVIALAIGRFFSRFGKLK